MKQRLVVFGNGMAGMRTVEELLFAAPDKYDITVFGAVTVFFFKFETGAKVIL